MLASLKGELQVASATGVFLFHQELVEWTSNLVVKDFILFSNISFFLPIPFWLGEKRSSSDFSSSARAEYFSSGSAFGFSSLLKKTFVPTEYLPAE